jgi:hypothetical protein
VSKKIKFTRQYKPISFGDRPDPGTVEATVTRWLRLLRLANITGG